MSLHRSMKRSTEAQKVRLTLTQDEAMALFIECQCCATGRHAEPYQAAKEKLYERLKKGGAFDD